MLFNYIEQPDFPPRPYVTPGSPIAIVRSDSSGQRHFALVRWGLIPSWVKEVSGKPLINARGETILVKPSFKNAMKRRRCLIPTDGFYEWEGDIPGQKRPYHIHRPDNGLFAFAGVWEHWMGADGSEMESAAIVTTDPNLEISRIHDRSPVVIHPQDFEKWLDVDGIDAESAAKLIVSPPDDYFVLEQTRIERKAPTKKVEKLAKVEKKVDQLKLF